MQLKRIRIYPIKSLMGMDLIEVGFTPVGALQNDRRWCFVNVGAASVTPDTVFMTKSEPTSQRSRLMQMQVSFIESAQRLSLEIDGQHSPTFQLPDEHDRLAGWCSDKIGIPLRLDESPDYGWPDTSVYGDAEFREQHSGPTLISTATLGYLSETLSISENDLFLRLRTNLLVHDSELLPFGEDNLETVQIDDVKFDIIRPVKRCPVPARDLSSGDYNKSFAKQLIDAKSATEVGKALSREDLYTASVFTKVVDVHGRLRTQSD